MARTVGKSRGKGPMQLVYGFLQYDLKDSSQMLGAGPHLLKIKDRLYEAIENVVALYNGVPLSRGGDGASFLFPVYDPQKCPYDCVALAGLHALRTVGFLNEPWNSTVPHIEPLVVRISCDAGNIFIDPKNVKAAHGDSLNWFLKGERKISLPGSVTITSSIQNGIEDCALRNMFVRWEKPYSSGKRVSKALFTYPISAVVKKPEMVLSWEDYTRGIDELVKKLTPDDNVGGFRPQLIVAISRGGMVFGDLLARIFNVPIITLWADRNYDAYPRGIMYDNPYNALDYAELVKSAHAYRILLVDDFCKMGGSLNGALAYLRSNLKQGLPPKDYRQIILKTAVLAKEARFDNDRQVRLDYCVYEDKEMFPYGRG